MSYGDSTAKRKMHLLRWSRTPEGVRQKFDYDKYGNQESSVLQKKDGDAYIKTTTAYDVTGNYPVSKTDARGKTATMETNPRTGTLTYAADPKGTRIDYTYDASNRITSVKSVIGKLEGQTDTRKPFQNEYTYENDRLKTVAHNTAKDASNPPLPTGKVIYSFDYDKLGAQTKVSVGDDTSSQTLSTNVYSADRTHKLMSTQFGNGGQVNYTYDGFDRLTEMSCSTDDPENPARYTYEYGANGQTAHLTDHNLHRTHWTEYDLAQRPKRTTTRDDATGGTVYQATLKYDKFNHLVSFDERVGDGAAVVQHGTDYTYDNDDNTDTIRYGDDAHTVHYNYDGLGRVNRKTVVNGASDTISYGFAPGAGKNATTPLVSSIKHSGIKEGTAKSTSLDFAYTYDDLGNIASETRGGVVTSYAYDDIGQLIRVDDPKDTSADPAGTTWVYEYDCGGNILSKKGYIHTTGTVGSVVKTFTYTYDATWKDLLVSYQDMSEQAKSIQYTPDDKVGVENYFHMGNPCMYDGWTYEWQAGRQLKSMTHKNAQNVQDKKLEFFYDAAGLRTQKKLTEGSTVTTTDYTLHGKLVVHQKVTKVVSNGTPEIKEMHFFYDAQGRPAMVNFNGTLYTYVHNLQDDIVGIVDSNGAKVVEYKYDAWGKPIGNAQGTMATTLGKLNPFRYRGYQFDEETGLYYLRSRYYNPEWGRFINLDIIDVTIEHYEEMLSGNLFSYCRNNPVALSDDEGEWGLPNLAKVAIGVAAIAVGVLATFATGGAAAPVLIASVSMALGSAATGAVIGGTVAAVTHRVETGSWDGAGKAALNGAIDGAADGFMWGGIAAGATFTTMAVKGMRVKEIGRLVPSNKGGEGYPGIKYDVPKANGRLTTKSFELHSPHRAGPHQMWHWQQNTWNPYNNSISSKSIHWTFYGRRI